jgi:integrase/recombinase XerD
LPTSTPDESTLKTVVMRMRERGLRATSCNCHLRAVNSYLTWASIPLKVPRLKEEQRILPTFTMEQIKKIVAWKPKGFCSTRLYVLVLVLVDTGCRWSEAAGLQWGDVDFDNLLLKLHGKGAKDRLAPFSLELRRHLWRWRQVNRWDLVFATRQGRHITHRNTLRDVGRMCEDLGIGAPARLLHAFRHTFAVNYIRRGGSVFHLQKVLGHSSLEMTRRYANLVTADLQAVHERVSLLSR